MDTRQRHKPPTLEPSEALPAITTVHRKTYQDELRSLFPLPGERTRSCEEALSRSIFRDQVFFEKTLKREWLIFNLVRLKEDKATGSPEVPTK